MSLLNILKKNKEELNTYVFKLSNQKLLDCGFDEVIINMDKEEPVILLVDCRTTPENDLPKENYLNRFDLEENLAISYFGYGKYKVLTSDLEWNTLVSNVNIERNKILNKLKYIHTLFTSSSYLIGLYIGTLISNIMSSWWNSIYKKLIQKKIKDNLV